MKKGTAIVLVLSSLALLYASSSRLLTPTQAVFLTVTIENTENFLESNTALLNEIRGVGGVLLVGGLVTMLGVFVARLRPISLHVGAVIFSGIVLGRLISFALEGIPSTEIVRIASVESFFCVLTIFCLADMYLRKKNG